MSTFSAFTVKAERRVPRDAPEAPVKGLLVPKQLLCLALSCIPKATCIVQFYAAIHTCECQACSNGLRLLGYGMVFVSEASLGSITPHMHSSFQSGNAHPFLMYSWFMRL